MPKHFSDMRLSNSSINFSNQNRISKDKWLLILASSIHDLVEKDRIYAEVNDAVKSERRLSKNESNP